MYLGIRIEMSWVSECLLSGLERSKLCIAVADSVARTVFGHSFAQRVGGNAFNVSRDADFFKNYSQTADLLLQINVYYIIYCNIRRNLHRSHVQYINQRMHSTKYITYLLTYLLHVAESSLRS